MIDKSVLNDIVQRVASLVPATDGLREKLRVKIEKTLDWEKTNRKQLKLVK